MQAITLQAGSMTTGRRSSPVPQLMYKGGSDLTQFSPSVVQCINRGHDGYDVQVTNYLIDDDCCNIQSWWMMLL